jgi:succinate dehydrogenase/fumarate reductase flavoprotein subunit
VFHFIQQRNFARDFSTISVLNPSKITGARLSILKSTRAQDLLLNTDGEVVGVRIKHKDGRVDDLPGGSVMIATGGYASDFAKGGLLDMYRPELRSLPTTNGAFATGDGLKMAMRIGAQLVGMTDVQVSTRGYVFCFFCLFCVH